MALSHEFLKCKTLMNNECWKSKVKRDYLRWKDSFLKFVMMGCDFRYLSLLSRLREDKLFIESTIPFFMKVMINKLTILLTLAIDLISYINFSSINWPSTWSAEKGNTIANPKKSRMKHQRKSWTEWIVWKGVTLYFQFNPRVPFNSV